MAGIDFLVGLATNMASKLVCGAIREGSYCCYFNNFVEDLKKEKQQLVECKKDWDNRVTEAEGQTKKVDSVVKWWLAEAESLIKEVETLEEKAEKNKNRQSVVKEVGTLEEKAEKNQSCCTGFYPNWVYRYILSKQLSKKKETIEKHVARCAEFKEFTRLASLPGIRYYSSEHFMDFESRTLARQQLVEALKDDEVSMVGLYGMGGCGKTTLAKEIGKEAEQFFKKVVFVVVSNNATVRGIQDKIASSLQIKLEETEETERAQRLCMSLKSGNEKMLMILDDVWQRLDFEAIGIPFREKGNSCKVLITTRSLSICKLMDCQKEIFLRILSFEESWDLFQKHAHITDESSNALKDFAKEITKKCDGLPVAIVAVASTLKGKTLDEWEVASKSLKRAKPIDVEEGLRNPYTCLELSYNSLKSKEAKSLFLLCSVFPEDWDIDVELLTRCAIGLGLFGRDSSNTMARKEVNVAKNKLINSCLLLEVDEEEEEEECVKMHDLVRDVALWIANKENKVILGPERCEDIMEEDATIKDSRIQYISCKKLPKQLDCSNLELLHVHTNSEKVKLPCEYFKGTRKLRVLVLESEYLPGIPVNLNSIQTLTCLRCLVLKYWELVDISFIGCLKALESLTLKGCGIQKLPEAIEQLTRLRLLEVSNCEIELNPFEVIGKYSCLEELYFFGNGGSEWKFDDENAAELLEKFSAPQQLRRYNVKLGEGKKDFNMVGGSVSGILVVEYFDASTTSASIMDLVGKAGALSLGNIKGSCRNVIPGIRRGITDLVELVVHDSKEIECLIDNNNLRCQVQSKLSMLHISGMQHLEALCHGPPSPALFEKLQNVHISECNELHGVLFVGKLNLCNLKVLEVEGCPKLTSIFTVDSAPSLSQLQHLEINECDELKHIIIEEENKEISEDDNDKMIKLPDLKFLSLSCLPSIVSFLPGNYIPVWPSLREFYLSDCPQFTTVTLNKYAAAGSDERQHQSPQMEMGPLIIHSNQKNEYMSRLQTLLDIETLSVRGSDIESIFQVATLPLNTQLSPPLSLRLKSLSLANLHELNCVWKGPAQVMSFQNLIELHIRGCQKIKSVFLACCFTSMSQLKVLKIIDCDQLEQIIADEEYQNIMNTGEESCPNSSSNSSALHPGSLNLCNLKQLTLSNCPMLRSLFTQSTIRTLASLEELHVSGCHGLKDIITYESAHECKNREMIHNDGDSQSHDSMFPKLKILYISRCNSLECLFPVTFSQGLMELESISIGMAPQLQYLFGEGSLEHYSSPQFQSLIQFDLPAFKYLTLRELPRFISICPNNYYVVCPSFQDIKLFRVGLSNPTTNVLKGGSEDRQWDNTCTSTKGLLLISNKATSSDEMVYLCVSPKCFMNLQRIEVYECRELKAMFDVSALRCLPQLKELKIENCEELEQITTEDEKNENMPYPYSKKVCFPQLKVLWIERCNKLKRLFSNSTSRELPKLECLIMKEASRLEQVFESEKYDTQERKEVVLPELKYLFLVQLPSLNNDYQGFAFPTVTCRVVQHCPSLTLATALQKSVEELAAELWGIFFNYGYSAYKELLDILRSTTKETINEDPMLDSEVSDSRNEPASRSEPAPAQVIKEKGKGIVEYGSASRTPVIAMPSTDVYESMDEQSINEPTLLGQQSAVGETEQSNKVPQEISISYDRNVEAEEIAKDSPTSKEAAIATFSDDIALPVGSPPKVSAQEPMKARNEAIMTNQQDFGEMTSYSHSNASHNVEKPLSHQVFNVLGLNEMKTKTYFGVAQGVGEGVLEDLPIKKDNTMTSLTDLVPESFTSLYKSSPQVLEKMDSMKKSLLMEQQAIRDREVTNDAPNIPSDLAKSAVEPENNNAPKVTSEEIAMETSLPKLENSSIYQSDSSLKKIFSQKGTTFEEAEGPSVMGPLLKSSHQNLVDGKQEVLAIRKAKAIAASSQVAADGVQKSLVIEKAKVVASSSQNSSNTALSPFSSTSTILLAELSTRPGVDEFSTRKEFLGSGPILEPRLLEEIKTKLAQDFSITVEALSKINTWDDVERIVNFFAKGTTDVKQNNILEDFKTQLKQFKDCVAKAISTKQSSLDFKSNYESLNVEQKNNLSEGQENHRYLECNLFESCAEENAVDLEIQQLIVRKMEILEQRKSLASQLNQSPEAVSKDYAEWKAMGEKLKVSTEKWLKLKEDLARANASWRLFKESIGL